MNEKSHTVHNRIYHFCIKVNSPLPIKEKVETAEANSKQGTQIISKSDFDFELIKECHLLV